MTVKGPFGVPVPQPAPPDQTKHNLDSHSHSLPTQVKKRRRALRGAPRPSLEPPLTSNTPPLPTKVKSNQSPGLSSPLPHLFPPSSPLQFFSSRRLPSPQPQPSAALGGLSPPLLLTLHSSNTPPLMLPELAALSPTSVLPHPSAVFLVLSSLHPRPTLHCGGLQPSAAL
jgi:hypothetical protein